MLQKKTTLVNSHSLSYLGHFFLLNTISYFLSLVPTVFPFYILFIYVPIAQGDARENRT